MSEISSQMMNITVLMVMLLAAMGCCVRLYADVIFYEWWEEDKTKWIAEIRNILLMIFAATGNVLINICLMKMGYGEKDYLRSIFTMILAVSVLRSTYYILIPGIDRKKIAQLTLRVLCLCVLQVMLTSGFYALSEKYLVISENWIWGFTEMFLVYFLCTKTITMIGTKLKEKEVPVTVYGEKIFISGESVNGKNISDSGKISGGL